MCAGAEARECVRQRARVPACVSAQRGAHRRTFSRGPLFVSYLSHLMEEIFKTYSHGHLVGDGGAGGHSIFRRKPCPLCKPLYAKWFIIYGGLFLLCSLGFSSFVIEAARCLTGNDDDKLVAEQMK